MSKKNTRIHGTSSATNKETEYNRQNDVREETIKAINSFGHNISEMSDAVRNMPKCIQQYYSK